MRGVGRSGILTRAVIWTAAGLFTAIVALSGPAGAADVRAQAFVESAVEVPGNGVLLPGTLFTPVAAHAPSGRRPAIVLLHGCGGMGDRRGKLSPRHRDWAERFARWGMVVLVLDSFTPRGLGSICELKDRPLTPWRERTSDAYAALDHLIARDDVDPDAVMVLGWSNGGSTVTGVVRPQAPGLRPIGPRFRAAIAFYPACSAPLRQQNYRTTMPLLILHGAADDWTPAAPCVELARRFADSPVPVRTVVYPGAYHGFDAPRVPVKMRPNVYNPGVPGERGAHVGTNEPARRQAIEEVRAFVAVQLGRTLPGAD